MPLRRTFYLLLLISVGHVLLISAQVQSKSGLPLVEAVAFGTFARVQQSTASVADAGRGLWTHYLALSGAATDNEALRRRVLELEGQMQEDQALIRQTRALEEALALQRATDLPTLSARVIAGSPSPEVLTVTIDRGAADGVEADMAVMASRGVIGRVIGAPAPHHAQVQLVISRGAAAGVTLERSGAGGIAVGGSGDPPIHLEFVPNTADVRAGDRVLTSGQDRMYPAGLMVGIVEQVERGPQTYRTVGVRPAVDFSHVEIVLVVLAKPDPAAADGSAAPGAGAATGAGRSGGRAPGRSAGDASADGRGGPGR